MKRLIAWFKNLFSNTLKMIIGVIMMITGGAIHAQDQAFPRDLTLSWTNASQYEDSTPIEAGDLASVRLECANNLTPTVLVIDQTVAANGEGLAQTQVFAGVVPTPGTYICYGWSIVTDGTESAPSNPATKKYLGVPMPPIAVTVT